MLKPMVCGVAMCIVVLASGALAADAPTCPGSNRAIVNWSQSDGTAKVSFSGTLCAAPPPCLPHGPDTGDLPLTTPPIVITLSDAAGRTLSGTLDTPQKKHGGCPGGHETYRIPGSGFRYIFGNQGQTTLLGGKIVMPAADAPTLQAPVTLKVLAGNGYSAVALLESCTTKQVTGGLAVTCKHVGAKASVTPRPRPSTKPKPTPVPTRTRAPRP